MFIFVTWMQYVFLFVFPSNDDYYPWKFLTDLTRASRLYTKRILLTRSCPAQSELDMEDPCSNQGTVSLVRTVRSMGGGAGRVTGGSGSTNVC